MASATETASLPETVVVDGVSIRMHPRAWEGLKLFETEITTYARELPRLLDEGQEGRTIHIKGNQVEGVWDTFGDAIQAARAKYGLEPLWLHTIRRSDL